jgi:dTDP-glucose pyrophosphorylase
MKKIDDRHDKNWENTILELSSSIELAIKSLNKSSAQIVLVVDEAKKLIGTISDGDIRRGFLGGLNLKSPIKDILNTAPFVVPEGVSNDIILRIMATNKIHQIPIINENGTLKGLHQWDKIGMPTIKSNIVVIMAGGLGVRLRPFTESCPKPLLPVDGKPMLEHIILRAKSEGFVNILIAINYLGSMIEEYFEDGSKFGVNIKYLKEDSPLGTAGALSLMHTKPSEPFLVTNGDLITNINFNELLKFHLKSNAIATMAVRLHELHHPYGVVKMNGNAIIDIEEKPIYRTHINAGIYVIDPMALQYLDSNLMCDMPDFLNLIRSTGHPVVAFPLHEPWLDVGLPDDYLKAQNIFKLNREK